MSAVPLKEVVEALRDQFVYCKDSGKFRLRRDSENKRWKAGRITEFNSGGGYLAIRVLGVRIPCHRAAWLYVHGEMPKGCIDHINGNKKDNRICNLRIATSAENARNSAPKSTNTSGYKGVTKRKDCNRWQAGITVNGRFIHLGNHMTPELAHAAYCNASEKYHSEFGRSS